MTKKESAVPFNIDAIPSNRIKKTSSVPKGSVTGFDRGEALGGTKRQGPTK
jgi:hypothetical protein